MLFTLNIIQSVLIAILAPLLCGVVKWLKCRLQNRRGPSIFQPYRNLKKLFSKESIIAESASKIFLLTPYIIFSIVILISAIIPVFTIQTPFSSIGDVIVIIGLFSLMRFFLTLAGMDIGTAFGGMGASREMMIATLAEPALFMAFFTLAVIASSTNLSVIVQHTILNKQILFYPSLLFTALGFAIVAVTETGRIPMDNPDTHLELTMIHEAMLLEYSGPRLALIEWTAQIKFMIYCILFINLFLPFGLSQNLTTHAIGISILSMLIKLGIVSIILSITEISLAKMRLFRVPYFLGIAFLFCLLGILNHIIFETQL